MEGWSNPPVGRKIRIGVDGWRIGPTLRLVEILE